VFALEKRACACEGLFRVRVFALATAAAFEGLTPSLAQAQETIGGRRATLARIPMQLRETRTAAEQLTLWLSGAQFRIEWGTKLATVPLQVRDG